MRNPAGIGRIFYGIAITGIGFQTIYYHDFPYMLIPARHTWIPDLPVVAYIAGILLMLAGACIVLEKKLRPASLLLGTILLLIFCFYFVPYQFMTNSNYLRFGTWENSAKELALSGGAFIVAGCFAKKDKSPLTKFLSKLIPVGVILFSITIISFGIDHFLFAKQAVGYMPSWVPYGLFWIYFCGVALLGSGLGILLKIKPGLMALLLGTMIFTWVIILHVPKSIATPFAYMGGEVTSAFLALAYCGTAFVIAGRAKNNN